MVLGSQQNQTMAVWWFRTLIVVVVLGETAAHEEEEDNHPSMCHVHDNENMNDQTGLLNGWVLLLVWRCFAVSVLWLVLIFGVLVLLVGMCMTHQRWYLSQTRPLAEIPYVVPHAPHAWLGHLPYLGQAQNVVDGQARVVRDGASRGPLGLVTFWTVHTPTVSVLQARTMRRWLCQSSARYPSPLQARHLQRLVGPSSVLLHNGMAWKWHRTVLQQHSFVVSSSLLSPQSASQEPQQQEQEPHESVLDEACRTFAQALVGTIVQEEMAQPTTEQQQEHNHHHHHSGWTTNALSIARRATLHVFGLAVLGHDFQCCCWDDEDSSSSTTNPTNWRLSLDRPVPVLDQMARLQQEYTRRLFQSSSWDLSRPWLYWADHYYYTYDKNHPHGWSSTSWWNSWVADTPANRQHAQDYHDLRHTLHDIVQERQRQRLQQPQDGPTTTNDNHTDMYKDDNRSDSSPRRNNHYRHHRQVWLDRLLLEQQTINPRNDNDNDTPQKEPQHSSDCAIDWNDASAVADWLVTILFGGYDTTALAVGYTLYLLAHFPKDQEHCAQEADRVLSSGSLSHDSWHQFPYITACLWEALRLYPPATVTARSLERPVTVDLTQENDNDWISEEEEPVTTTTRTRTTTTRVDEPRSDMPHSPSQTTTSTTTTTNNKKRIVTLPSQTRILCSFYWIHRDRRNFARPLEFLPQRWVQRRKLSPQPPHEPCHNTGGDHNTTTNSSIWEPRTADPDHNHDDNSVPRGDPRNHLAFSAGGRNCVGQGLALDMIPRILAHVLQSVQVETCCGATGGCITDQDDHTTQSRSRTSKEEEEEPASSSSACIAPELTLVRYGLNAVPKDGIPLVFWLRQQGP